MTPNEQNILAQKFASYHNPRDSLVLLNAFDAGSATIIAEKPGCKALATASYAVAQCLGFSDDGLTLEQNLQGSAPIIAAGVKAGKPVTCDLQDGYGDKLEQAIKQIIALGAVGCNLEDFDRSRGRLWSVQESAARVKKVKQAAAAAGVPDFVVNARTDVLFEQEGATLADAVERGKAYLAAGGTTVFVWGGPRGRGVSREEIQILVKEFGGMLNVSMKLAPGFLNVKDLMEIGVARISIGPGLYRVALDTVKASVDRIYV